MHRIFKISGCFLALSLSACSNHYYKSSQQGIRDTEKSIAAFNRDAARMQPAVLVRAGYYVDRRPMRLDQHPAWMDATVTLRAKGMPLRALLVRLLAKQSVNFSFDATLNANQLVTLEYQGTIEGALHTIAANLNINYENPKSHELIWSAFEDKTFDVSFMPGVSQYMVGRNSSGSAGPTSSDASGSSSTLKDQQYSNLSAKLSLWQDLNKTLLQLKSPDGQVMVSQSTTSVTVHDRPHQVRAMAHFIRRLNKSLAKEVLVKVKILEVQLNHDFNFGINWGVLARSLGTNFSLTGSMANTANIVRNSLVLSSTSSRSAGFSIGSVTQTLIQSLGEQGKVRIVTEPQVMTMNNQMGSIRITKNTAYIASVSRTQSENFSTTSVTPGHVTDGFTLYVLPKIQGDRVFLQVSSTIAHLDRLDKMSTQPTSSTEDSPNYQAIQLPTLSQKSFNQRSFIKSGSTLIMAGFRRMEDQTKKSSFFGVNSLGGRGAFRENLETLILITPIIIESPDSHVYTDSK